MIKKTFITSMLIALPLTALNAQVLGEERVLGNDVQEGAEIEEEQARVLDRDSKIIDRNAGNFKTTKEIDRGATDVQYKAQRKITQTLLKEEQIPTVQFCETKANINAMKAEDFKALGFDQKTAQAIIQKREQQGAFKSVDDLSQIQGVSGTMLNQVRTSLGVASQQAQEAQ